MYVHHLSITNVRGFSGNRCVDLEFDKDPRATVFDRYPGFTVIAGRNGSGKTTLLRAMAAALAGPEIANSLTEGDTDWVSHGSDDAVVEIEVRRDDYEKHLGTGRPASAFAARIRWRQQEGVRPRPQADWPRGNQGGRMAERSLWAPKPTGWFASGYGPFRRLAGTSGEVARLMSGDWTAARFATLFREEASLAETVAWLQQVNYRSRSNRPSYRELEVKVLELLNDGLFPDGHMVDRVDPDGLWVRREGAQPIRIEEMSDGYRTVTALVTDIIRHIHECFDGEVEWSNVGGTPIVNTSGVVLIDEVDVHLHVSWQQRIGPWLTEHFPFIQFIVTTHSPYICQTADPGGLIRLPGAGEDFAPEVVDEETFRRVANGSADDAVLTELFGLDSPYSLRVGRLRERMMLLERLVIRDEATDVEVEEFKALVNELEPSPLSRAQDVLESQQ